jgi:hypothetical protein
MPISNDTIWIFFSEPATFRFVAQYLNHCATAVPYVCMCLCIYIYVCLSVCMYLHTYTVYVYIHIYIYMSVCMCVCMYIAFDIQAAEILYISKPWVLSLSLENSVSTRHFAQYMNGINFYLLRSLTKIVWAFKQIDKSSVLFPNIPLMSTCKSVCCIQASCFPHQDTV